MVEAKNYAKICLHGSSLLRNAKFSSGVLIAYCLPSVINGSKFAKISLRAGSHGGRYPAVGTQLLGGFTKGETLLVGST